MSYKDLRDNFPDIFRILKSRYYEGLESYRVPSSISWTRRHSRTSVKRTAKKQAGERKMHEIEKLSQFPGFSGKKFTGLVLRFFERLPDEFIAPVNHNLCVVVFRPRQGGWLALLVDRQFNVFLSAEDDRSAVKALSRLAGQKWYRDMRGRLLSLYDVYESVVFHLPYQRTLQKAPRNGHISPKVPHGCMAVWQNIRGE